MQLKCILPLNSYTQQFNKINVYIKFPEEPDNNRLHLNKIYSVDVMTEIHINNKIKTNSFSSFVTLLSLSH